MLEQAAHLHDRMRRLKQEDAGRDSYTFLQRPYSKSQAKEAVRKAPVWFTAYMPSILGQERDGEMTRPLETLCHLRLWNCFAELGIRAIHTGPVMKAGGQYLDRNPYPSIDGWFDPIGLEIDSDLGSERDYSRLVWIAENMPTAAPANKLGAVVIGDIVPGHTGMGPDFHLALQDAAHYPGLFVLARVDEVLDRRDRRHRKLTDEQIERLRSYCSNCEGSEFTQLLEQEDVDALVEANVIPGEPQRRMGAQAGLGWSITKPINGVPDENGQTSRRWVYLHFFHPKQPTLNFFDPGYSAWRLVTGQLNYIVWDLRSTGVRLDANAFLGIEPKKKLSGSTALSDAKTKAGTWSEAHPLSETVTNMLAWQARRLDGFSFQEMNMSIPDIAKTREFGPDLAYDFITRPACEHALLTGDTSLLRFMYEEMKVYGVNPGSLVHALQNHDEFTYELVHLVHLENEPEAGHRTRTFEKSSDVIRAEMRRVALHRDGDHEALRQRESNDFYNKESPNGLCTTVAGLLAARLGCQTLDQAALYKTDIQRGHLLLAAFNALQPGVFAVSGWDLVGAMPIEESKLPKMLLNAGTQDKQPLERDYRWVNRGAYRLLSDFGPPLNSSHGYGCFNLPEATALYGPLDEQRNDPESFFSELKELLAVRERLEIATAQFDGVCEGLEEGLFGIRMTLEMSKHTEPVSSCAIFNFRSPQENAGPVCVSPAACMMLTGRAEIMDLFPGFREDVTAPQQDGSIRLGSWEFGFFYALPELCCIN